MEGRFLFLGTGGSMGVPVIGCKCSVCGSCDPRNKRKRSAGLIQVHNKKILLDAGPDIREQLLQQQVRELDGALLTHVHYDHIAGIDDLKAFYFQQQRKLPCLVSENTLEEIKLRYHYLMQASTEGTMTGTHLDFLVLKEDFEQLVFEGVPLECLTYFQMDTKVTGCKIGNFAYVSDIHQYSPRLTQALQGIGTLVVSALRDTSSPMHFSLDEATAFAREVGARRTFFTHIAHNIEHEATNAKLPPDIRLSYDGLEITFDVAT